MNRRYASLITLAFAACVLLAACSPSPSPPATQTATPAETAPPVENSADTDRGTTDAFSASNRPAVAHAAAPENSQSAYEAALQGCNDLLSQRGKEKCKAAATRKFDQGTGEASSGTPDETAAAADEPGSPEE